MDRLIGDVFLSNENGQNFDVGSLHKQKVAFREGYDSEKHTIFVKGIVRELGTPFGPDSDAKTPPCLPKHPPNFTRETAIHGENYKLRIYVLPTKKKEKKLNVDLEHLSNGRHLRRVVGVDEILASFDHLEHAKVREALKSQDTLFSLIADWTTIENNEVVVAS